MMHPLNTWLNATLRPALDRVTRRRAPQLPAPQVLIETPEISFGYGDLEQPFHPASIGKNFLAVVIGRLVEDGRLSLSTPIREVLGERIDLARLPAFPGVDPGRDITVELLLAHRAGLPDPFLPPRGFRTACSLTAIAADPSRGWAIEDFVAEMTGLPAAARPGGRFHYSDGGYALLSLLAEEAGGAPIADLLHREVFAPAGMTRTHQLHPGAEPEGLSPMLLAGTDVSRMPALSIGSVDGGAITTAHDLIAFQRAVYEGRLISPELLADLTRPRSRLRPGIHYGLGFATLQFDGFMPFILRGLPRPVGGLGLTAAHAFHYRDHDAHVVLNFHSTRAMNQSFRTHIAIARALARRPL